MAERKSGRRSRIEISLDKDWSTPELFALLRSVWFYRKHKIIRNELLQRRDIPLEEFEQLHNTPECNVTVRDEGPYTVTYQGIDFPAFKSRGRLGRFQCETHGGLSERFFEDTFGKKAIE